jgi:thioredoxin-like negative regulator of GroEL
MCRKIAVLLIISVCLSPIASAGPLDDIRDLLVRAEALYYEADFAKSLELLMHADELVRTQPGSLPEKTQVKLQLALGMIGLNDTTRARTYLDELYAIDPEFQIDPQMYSPKVIRLAEEAKANQTELRCRAIIDETQKQLGSGNGDGVVKLIAANQARCSGLATFYPKAADLVFKDGLDAYKKGDMTAALQKFRAALAVEPKHELAAQYVDLTQSKLELTAERVLLTWKQDFTAGDFVAAAKDYRELELVSTAKTMDDVHLQYRQALTKLIEAWNHACAGNDTASMESIRVQIKALLPQESFGQDLLANMKTCTPGGCIQMDSHAALARLTVRVDPQFPPNMKSQIRNGPVRVMVKTRVSDKGLVVSSELQGGTPLVYNAIRTALDRWRFSPALTDSGPRCFDAEIPFVINVEN